MLIKQTTLYCIGSMEVMLGASYEYVTELLLRLIKESTESFLIGVHDECVMTTELTQLNSKIF